MEKSGRQKEDPSRCRNYRRMMEDEGRKRAKMEAKAEK